MADERSGPFLPPEPPGPEPELGKPPAEAPTQRPPDPGPQAPSQGPPAAPPPPPGGWYPQQQPPGWQQPPPWGYPQPPEPDNGPAVAGFVLSLVSGGLLLFSAGLSSIVSLGCAIAAIIYSRRGKRKVDAGETRKNRSLAQAGFIIGIVSLVLSLLATAFWLIFLIAALNNEEFRRDFEREFEQSDSIRASAQVVLALVRAGLHLLS
jgi:hypothetical protein